MEVISPIESVCLYGLSTNQTILSLCTLECGVLFFDVTYALEDTLSVVDLEMSQLRYQIKSYFKRALPSPSHQSVACLTGINNQVYIYDMIAQEQEHVAISTYPECCDQMVWSNDSTILLCYQKTNPSNLYFVHPMTRTSQKVGLKKAKDDVILVGCSLRVRSGRLRQQRVQIRRLRPFQAQKLC